MKRFSLFDFDGTLTRHDSFTGFIRHVYGFFGLIRVLLASAPAIILWKTGFRDNTYAKLRMFSAAFRGMHSLEFQRLGKTYSDKIEKMIRPEVKARLNEAASRGDTVAIVSASLGDWIRPWAERHGVHAVISTEAEIDSEGKLTGGFSTPNCQRAEKVRRFLESFPDVKEHRGQYEIFAYGDSDGDNDMLDFADHGIRI